MFRKGQPELLRGYNSFIEQKASINGDIFTESSFYLAGKLNGDLRSEGDVYIDAEGVVSGNVYAKNIYVAGNVEGGVEASGFLKIAETGKLYGDAHVFRLITDEGAIFEGKCSMSDISSIKPLNPEMRKIKPDAMFRKKDYMDSGIPPLMDEVDKE